MHLILTLFAITFAVQTSATPPTTAPPSISVRIATEKPVVKSGTEIRLRVTVSNITSHQISIFRVSGPVQGELHNKLDVTDSAGKLAARTVYGRLIRGEPAADGAPKSTNTQGSITAIPQPSAAPDVSIVTSSSILIALEPGKSIQDDIVANKLYALTSPGTYTFLVHSEDPETKSDVSSNSITVTVVP